MDYKEKYEQGLECIQEILCGAGDSIKTSILRKRLQPFFPELKESEDERIKFLIKSCVYASNITPEGREEIFAWLEKQGEQNFDYEHADIPQKDFAPIDPKFKIGDWLQYRYAEPFLVKEITEQGYCNGNSCLPFEWEDEIHLWDIQDAEDGDVLVDVYGNIGIFKKCYDFDWMSYCSLGNNGGFQVFTVEHENEKTYPATKEQCKLLFQKMKEDGWEWDAEKKELKTYRTI